MGRFLGYLGIRNHNPALGSVTDTVVVYDQSRYLIKTSFTIVFISRVATEQMLKDARERQVKDKEHFLAVQAACDRAEFERVLK